MKTVDHELFTFGQLIRAYDHKDDTNSFVEGRIIEEAVLLNSQHLVYVVLPERIFRRGVEQLFLPGGVVYVPYRTTEDYDGRIEFVLSDWYVYGMLATLIVVDDPELAEEMEQEALAADDVSAFDDFADGEDDMWSHITAELHATRMLARVMGM